MEYISSDTNIWLDFETVNRLDYPFKLPYTYLMNDEAVDSELVAPEGLGKRLIQLGLEKTELTLDEFFFVEEYVSKYSKPSTYDCVALAIAKARGIVLLTGDKALRKAAETEGVKVIGTIGILDQLYENNCITEQEYLGCMKDLLDKNGGKIRLPENELKKRIAKFEK